METRFGTVAPESVNGWGSAVCALHSRHWCHIPDPARRKSIKDLCRCIRYLVDHTAYVKGRRNVTDLMCRTKEMMIVISTLLRLARSGSVRSCYGWAEPPVMAATRLSAEPRASPLVRPLLKTSTLHAYRRLMGARWRCEDARSLGQIFVAIFTFPLVTSLQCLSSRS
jgi:hypothetical protein